MMNHTQLLNSLYSSVLTKLQTSNNKVSPDSSLSLDEINALNLITDNAESFKAVCTVLITSLTHKLVDPTQDIRNHQSSLPQGYSGRRIDTKFITPFLKEKQLLHMEESGWLTRSLEHNQPYTFDYNGQINNPQIKLAFLTLLDNIETKNANPQNYLDYLLQKLILIKNTKSTSITPLQDKQISIDQIMTILSQHFTNSTGSGTARLPVLALYSIYQCMMNQLQRYHNKTLLPLKSHTSADSRSGDIGDIQVNYNDQPFEAVEIKHNINITQQLVKDAYRKVQNHPVQRYYLLSTADISQKEQQSINQEINLIAQKHGCQFITNGLMTTIKYYLRLLSNPTEFINNYSNNLIKDPVIKIEHQALWQQLLANFRK